MTSQTTKIQTTEDMLKRILHMLEESQERSTSGNGTLNECCIYTNKELMKLLGVESRYLKNLRDNGNLSYSFHFINYHLVMNQMEL